MAKKSPPSSLSIKRSGNKFTFAWKKAGKHFEKQQAAYRLSNTGWIDLKPDKNTTSKSITVDFSKYYPVKKTKLTWVEFRVRGSGGDGKPKTSSWVTKRFSMAKPSKPTLTATLSDSNDHLTTFTWAGSKPNDGGKHCYRFERKAGLETDDNDGNAAKAPYGTPAYSANNGSQNLQETNSIDDGKSHTRWYAVRAQGCAGNSDWAYAKHVYAQPLISYGVKATVDKKDGYQCIVEYKTRAQYSRPIDGIDVEYVIATPGAGLSCPSGLSWNKGSTIGRQTEAGKSRFHIDDTLSENECLFVRVNTKHDHETNTTYGIPVLADVGLLPAPALSTPTPDETTHTVYVEATNESSIPDSFLAVEYVPSSDPESAYVVAVMPHGYTSVTAYCPDWSGETSYQIKVYAVVGTYERSTTTEGLPAYNIKAYAGKQLMVSAERVWDSGVTPAAPTSLVLQETDVSGTILVSWKNEWADSTGTELSWADHPDAWESTDEPSDFEISNPMTTKWRIAGLDLNTWYVRVRSYNDNGDKTLYSPYSVIRSISLTGVPSIPVIELSSYAITEGTDLTVTWSYESSDGSVQSLGQLCEIIDVVNQNDEFVLTADETITPYSIYYERTGSGTAQDPYVYEQVLEPEDDPVEAGYYVRNRKILAETQTEKHITVSTIDLGWKAGEIHYVAVKVESDSGMESESWSKPTAVAIAPELTCTISSTSLETIPVTIDDETHETENMLALTDLPLTVKVDGAGDNNTTTLVVERATSYFAMKPDESEFHGYEGETVFSVTQTGDAEIVLNIENQQASLDDGGEYYIRAQTVDGYGQVATAEPIKFIVKWEHQAVMPEASVYVQNNVVIITPTLPEAAKEYRHTADVELDETKIYFTVVGTEVESPSGDDLGLYYELSNDIFTKTSDTAVATGKTYYTIVATAVAEPDVSDIGEYYEYIMTDMCDIYRLSADKPELIYEGAEWDTAYVDPYPTIGKKGGHRVVYRTRNNDYITRENELAWIDLDYEDGDVYEVNRTIIDFNGEQIQLNYNIDLSYQWAKDFEETKYLGGSIQGDWNPAVSRTGTISAVALTIFDQDTIDAMRRLATYPGLCHIRTQDGSNFDCDIQVSESRTHDDRRTKATFSLSVTRVDPVDNDGLRYTEFEQRLGNLVDEQGNQIVDENGAVLMGLVEE